MTSLGQFGPADTAGPAAHAGARHRLPARRDRCRPGGVPARRRTARWSSARRDGGRLLADRPGVRRPVVLPGPPVRRRRRLRPAGHQRQQPRPRQPRHSSSRSRQRRAAAAKSDGTPPAQIAPDALLASGSGLDPQISPAVRRPAGRARRPGAGAQRGQGPRAWSPHTRRAARWASSANRGSTCSSSTWRWTDWARGTLEAWRHSPDRHVREAGSGSTSALLRASARPTPCSVRGVVAPSAAPTSWSGFVETHGRQHTAEMLDGLEVVPRHTLPYRDSSYDEMDVDAVLARRPEAGAGRRARAHQRAGQPQREALAGRRRSSSTPAST